MTLAYDPTNITDTESESDYDKTTPELNADELLIRIRSWWREDYPACKEWHSEAKEDFRFRSGDQWPDEDKSLMQETQKRACLTFNQIDPVIDAVAGSEITNRQEVRFIPRQVGDAPVNEVLTEAARWFRDQCDAEHEESAAFTDAATCGMGWTETRLDYEDNPNGDPKIERIDPIEMVWDNSAKQANLTDARRIFRVTRKTPLNEAKSRWPLGLDGQPILDDAVYNAAWAGEETEDEEPYVVHTAGEPLIHESEGGRRTRTVTLVQVQWFERQDYYRAILMDPTTGQPQPVAEISEQQHMIASQRAAMLGIPYQAVKQTRKVYYRAFVGGEVLEVTKITGPTTGANASNFSLIPITAKWDRNNGQFYGLVRAMRGPQTFANKWLSTTVEIMARGSKGGLMLEEGAVVDVEDFENSWAKPGANSYFRPGAITGGRVQAKPPVVFPGDMMQMTQFAIQSIRNVTGVNPEVLGLAQQDQPASLEYQRRQSATVILAPLFDSLRRYRRIEGRALLFLITEFLADGRLIRIMSDSGAEQYVPLVHNPGVTEFDVIVDDAPSSPSQKELVWNSMVQMMPMLQNMNPPPQVILALLDYSPLPASVVAKIKQALADASQNAPPPPPDPMTLMMQQKQIEVQGDAQKKAQELQFKQQSQALDIAHERAKAQIQLESQLALAHVKAGSAAAMNGGSQQPHPLAEGFASGIKAGAQRFATELTAGRLAQQAGLPEGPPVHLGMVPEGPTAPQQAVEMKNAIPQTAVGQV